MSIMKQSALTLCITASLGMSSLPVLAHDAGDWLVRGRIININPNDENNGVTKNGGALTGFGVPDGLVSGTELGVEDAWTLDIDITYMITDNWGVELLLDPSTQHDVVAKGSTYPALGTVTAGAVPAVPIGTTLVETRVLPPALILQYHFMPHEQIQPYVGLGLNYTIFFDESATDAANASLLNVTDLELENSFGVAAQVGADFMMDNGWFANIDLKYIDINTTAKFNSGALGYSEAEVDIDPWVIGVGIGRSF